MELTLRGDYAASITHYEAALDAGGPVRAALRGQARGRDVDEVVTPAELRPWLAATIEMAYQAIGYRRVKNPRIWSLHDLAALRGGSGARS